MDAKEEKKDKAYLKNKTCIICGDEIDWDNDNYCRECILGA